MANLPGGRTALQRAFKGMGGLVWGSDIQRSTLSAVRRPCRHGDLSGVLHSRVRFFPSGTGVCGVSFLCRSRDDPRNPYGYASLITFPPLPTCSSMSSRLVPQLRRHRSIALAGVSIAANGLSMAVRRAVARVFGIEHRKTPIRKTVAETLVTAILGMLAFSSIAVAAFCQVASALARRLSSHPWEE